MQGFEWPLRSRQTLIPFAYPLFHIPSFDALLGFLDLISSFILPYYHGYGYTRVLYYFHSLSRRSDSENVCKFDIWLDIRTWISCINAFFTTFLRNLFVTVHIEIPFSFKATIKNICIDAITILNFDFHGPSRLLRALVRRTGCTPHSWGLFRAMSAYSAMVY